MMKTTLSHRVNQIKVSPTLALSATANRLKNMGKPIINLSVGEPDFDTPESIKQAARNALEEGFTKYTAVDGYLPLKQAIIHKFKNENQLDYCLNQVIVSTGAKQCIFNLMQALLNPGDEVLIPAPYWVSYLDITLLAEARPIILPTSIEQHLKITPEQLKAAITPKTRLLIINSPANPTGMVYSTSELKKLSEVLLPYKQIFILTDDIYEHIYWGEEKFQNIVNLCPELYDRTLVLNGCSKAYAMTGWRIGYAAGPPEVIESMAKIQSQSTSGANSIAQFAAVTALTNNQNFIQNSAALYQERYEFFSNGLNQIPHLIQLTAQGAFYCFPCFKAYIGLGKAFRSDYELADYLLNKAYIAVVPGSAFGAPGYLRFSFAIDMQQLKQALEQLKAVLENIKG